MNANATCAVTSSAPDDARAAARRARAPFFAEGLAQVHAGAGRRSGIRPIRKPASARASAEREGDDRRVDRRPRCPAASRRGRTAAASARRRSRARARARRRPAASSTVSVSSCARDPREPGAERVPRRQLLHARARADEHQVGDVDGADEQHEDDAAPEQVERAAQVAHQVVLQRHDDGVEAGVDQDLFELGKAIEVARVQRVDLLARLLDRRARLQPRDVRPVVAVARVVRFLLGA